MTENPRIISQQPTANSQQPTANSQQRNLYLDVAKGIAIILVVIGHEIQCRYGTEVLSFKLIYSFHMSLFMFLAGMVFSLKFHDFPSQSLNVCREILKSVRRLLIPLICWTLIYGAVFHRDELPGYFWKVIEYPPYSLWFLIVLFWCRIFFVTVHALCTKLFRKPSVILLAVIMTVLLAASRLFFSIGNLLGYGFAVGYFPYFAAGVFMYQYRSRLSRFLDSIAANTAVIIIFVIMFVISLSSWYSDMPVSFEARIKVISWYGEILYQIIKRTKSLPGIFLMLSLTKIILRSDFKPVINVLAFTGKKTLGIYALHGFFLGIFPPVILPLSASLILTVIIEKIPLIRTGRRKFTPQISQKRLTCTRPEKLM